MKIVKLKLNLTEIPEYLTAFCDVLERGGAVTIVMGLVVATVIASIMTAILGFSDLAVGS